MGKNPFKKSILEYLGKLGDNTDSGSSNSKKYFKKKEKSIKSYTSSKNVKNQVKIKSLQKLLIDEKTEQAEKCHYLELFKKAIEKLQKKGKIEIDQGHKYLSLRSKNELTEDQIRQKPGETTDTSNSKDTKKTKKRKREKECDQERVPMNESPESRTEDYYGADEKDIIDEALRVDRIRTEDKNRSEDKVEPLAKKKKHNKTISSKEKVEEFELVSKFQSEGSNLDNISENMNENPKTPNSILLFYAYCDPPMTRVDQDEAISHAKRVLSANGVTGRLRVGKEGYNGTLTGPYEGVRAFTAALVEYDRKTFEHTDFKFVDNMPENQLLKELKVFPVTEIVTYGFSPSQAPLDMRGTHLSPQDFHKALEDPNSVVIDVRNFNETLIGKFAPPKANVITHNLENGKDTGKNDSATTNSSSELTSSLKEKTITGGSEYLDPCMRRSTEFPAWVHANKDNWRGKKVLMYCTAGVRCERASAFMRNSGVENVFQLQGGIHRYLEEFYEDGGYWVGKNYTFDKRFNHGAKNAETVSTCVYCLEPWDRYQARAKCFNKKCGMEVLLCRTCHRQKPNVPKNKLFCPLCLPNPPKHITTMPTKAKVEEKKGDKVTTTN